MGKININYQNGGIGGIIASNDGISGFVFDTETIPSGFEVGETKPIFGMDDVESLGITNNHLNEVKATGGGITITAAAGANEIIKVVIKADNQNEVEIGRYVTVTGDDVNDIAAGLANSISLNPLWDATVSTNVISLVAPDGLGESINGAGVILVSSSNSETDLTTTIGNFTGGEGSVMNIVHFILSSFFAANPTSKIWVTFRDFTSAFDANVISDIQTASDGEIRQLGIWTQKNLSDSSAIITAANSVAENQASKYKPLSVVLAFANAGSATISNLDNLRTLSAKRVSVTISNAWGNIEGGYILAGTTGLFPTDLGTVIGLISRSKVSNSIAWVEKNVTGVSNTMLITGEKWNQLENTTYPDELAQKGYLFQRKYFGYAGCYIDNDSVCDSLISDFDSIKRMRTIDKVARIGYFSLVPYLSSPVVLDAEEGTLSLSTISKLESVLNSQINAMFNASEISGFQVFINPTQNVLVNKNININITIVPIGSADSITINLGYALALA